MHDAAAAADPGQTTTNDYKKRAKGLLDVKNDSDRTVEHKVVALGVYLYVLPDKYSQFNN
jgi:hypothetical protein